MFDTFTARGPNTEERQGLHNLSAVEINHLHIRSEPTTNHRTTLPSRNSSRR